MENLNKYKRWNTQLLLMNNEYWDFVISNDTTPMKYIDKASISSPECISAYINLSNSECIKTNGIVSMSDFTWSGATNNIDSLKDIGLTGMDNGIILFDKSTISNKEFYDLLTTSELKIESDKRLFLYSVSGNTQDYSYPIEYDDANNCFKLKGGFWQGFFKIYNQEYQVLPTDIENEWNLEFVLKPEDYGENNTLNSSHPDNKGIFFYIGCRSENKFAQFYNSNINEFPDKGVDDYCDSDYFKIDWEIEPDNTSTNKLELLAFLYAQYRCDCGCQNGYNNILKSKITNNESSCENYLLEEGYFTPDEKIDIKIMSSNGNDVEKRGYYEINTDNKFLTFDRTKNGFTVDTWNDNIDVKLTGYNRSNDNLYLTVNRTKDGKTASDLREIYEEKGDTSVYDIISDIQNNCFALRITDNGEIGYRYLINDCDNENRYTVLEEYSFPNIIKKSEWNVVNVKLAAIGNKKMKIKIFVNGGLVFVSKELPKFRFRELNDYYDKQETVPYNISLGGGTQGLCETIWINFRQVFNKLLPIEENFAGTFIGDIKSFKFYTCPLDINEIINNYKLEKNNII